MLGPESLTAMHPFGSLLSNGCQGQELRPSAWTAPGVTTFFAFVTLNPPSPILQSKMARWPKEQPSTWYSQYKRGSLVSGHLTLPACSSAWLWVLHGPNHSWGHICYGPLGQNAPHAWQQGPDGRDAPSSRLSFHPGSRWVASH